MTTARRAKRAAKPEAAQHPLDALRAELMALRLDYEDAVDAINARGRDLLRETMTIDETDEFYLLGKIGRRIRPKRLAAQAAARRGKA